jgi:trimethylamine--corrinoid protein Co-methyltransferase
MKPVEINDETLALDVIHSAGPGGNFIAESHTAKHFRGAWFPRLLDRQNYEAWAADGKQTMGERARQVVRDILTEHEPDPLSPDRVGQIQSVIEAAESRGEE